MLEAGAPLSKALALTLLIMVILLGYQVILQPTLDLYRNNQAKISQSRDLLHRYRQLAAQRDSVAENLATMREDQDLLVGYINEASDALAAAEIQDSASKAITSSGGEMKSVQTTAAQSLDEQQGTRQIGLKFQFSATIDGLASALYELETADPYLFVDSLKVTTPGSQHASRGAAVEPKLDVRIEVFGYMLAER
jgi:general secretion pathway protein M